MLSGVTKQSTYTSKVVINLAHRKCNCNQNLFAANEGCSRRRTPGCSTINMTTHRCSIKHLIQRPGLCTRVWLTCPTFSPNRTTDAMRQIIIIRLSIGWIESASTETSRSSNSPIEPKMVVLVAGCRELALNIKKYLMQWPQSVGTKRS